MSNLTELPATELNKLFTTKQASAQEITEAHLAKIGKLNPEINAFVEINNDLALKQAKKLDSELAAGQTMGKLAGVPIGIKDLMNLNGSHTRAGSKMLQNHKSVYNATIVNKVIEAGAIPMGKLNLDEFAMGSSNENSAFGPCKNPHDLSKVAGGSSGGSAAAVAAGLVPLAFGTDTGGSIRQPAAFCGIVGAKPTYGRVSRYGIIAFASSLDQAGPMTTNVQDNALLMEVMSGHDPLDSTSLDLKAMSLVDKLDKDLKGLRVGIANDFFVEGLNSEIKAKVEEAIKTYQGLGAEIVEIKLDKIKYGLPAYYIIAPSEASSNLSRYDGVRFGFRDEEAQNLNDLYFKSRANFGAEVKRRIMLGVYALSSGYYDAYYKKAQQVRRLIANDFDTAFSKCDLILSPTTPNTAFSLGDNADDPLAMYLSDVMTVTVNLAGLPAMSINCGFDSNKMPIGMQLIAPALQEEKMYQAAYAFERVVSCHLSLSR